MRNSIFILFVLVSTLLKSQDVYIPDSTFVNYLVSTGIDNNGDGIIQASEALNLTRIEISDPRLMSLTGISSFENIITLILNETNIPSLDLSANLQLTQLSMRENLKLSSLNVTENTALTHLTCDGSALQSIDLTQNTRLTNLVFEDSELEKIDLSSQVELKKLWVANNEIFDLDLRNNNKLELLVCTANNLSQLDIAHLLDLTWLSCGLNELTFLDLKSNLELNYLSASNNDLESIDLSSNTELTTVKISKNQISEIDVSHQTKLTKLECGTNQIRTLDVSLNPLLITLACNRNLLNEIFLNANPELEELYVDTNGLTDIDLSNNPKLSLISIWDNNITQIDLSIQKDNLLELICFGNPIKSLDFSNLTQPIKFEAGPGLLELNTTNNNVDDISLINDMSITTVLCTDDGLEKNNIINADWYKSSPQLFKHYTNCLVPLEYLSFKNKLRGSVFYDQNGNCDNDTNTSTSYLYLKADLDTLELGIHTNVETGTFDHYIPSGSYSLTAEVDDQLFKVMPESVEVNLDGNKDVSQDFCITPTNDLYSDLTLKIIPNDISRPGFENTFKLTYQNIGNIPADGKVSFYFDEELVTFLNADQEVNTNNGKLTFEFTKLLPFEVRTVAFSFRLNSPMETPSLNDGDIIVFKALAEENITSRSLNPYCAYLEEPIVNSFDPNDKRCLQGSYFMDSLVGTPLDYMIRFENTGSAAAVNIRVDDKIDTTAFELSSIKVLESSHPVQTYIEGDIVSFYFEQILLPSIDSANDGYVLFEINTKTNLSLASKVSNTAEIFFDYNFPITTNTTTTIIVTDADEDGFHNELDCNDDDPEINPDAEEIIGNDVDENCDGLFTSSSNEVVNGFSFSLFPNPSSTMIQILADNEASYFMECYDATGNLQYSGEYSGTRNLDISDYPSGIYVLILRQKKKSFSKFFLKK